jgi:predicted component of viral defense system (DUF524 family)
MSNHPANDDTISLLKQALQKIDALTIEVRQLSGSKQPSEQYYLIDKDEAAKRTGLSASTLKEYRLMQNSPLIEGIHYERINSRSLKYRSPLIEHWAASRNAPDSCLTEIEKFIEYQKSGTRRFRDTPA